MARLRVVLDTNVLVSAIAYPESVPGRILRAWQEGAVGLALSRTILDEMARVLPRLNWVMLSAAEIQDLADSFLFMAEVVEPVASEVVTRGVDEGIGIPSQVPKGEGPGAPSDRADEAVLGTLLAAKADYLVTGNKDLLALAGQYPILTPAGFWERHGD